MSLKIIGAGFGRTGMQSFCVPEPVAPNPKVNTTEDFRNYNRKAPGGHCVWR